MYSLTCEKNRKKDQYNLRGIRNMTSYQRVGGFFFLKITLAMILGLE
jgi:hypothetical protein